ncbi:MAG: chorismate mutase, partial [Chloroflexi bacterium]
AGTRLESALRAKGDLKLVAYMMAGHPTAKRSIDVGKRLAASGIAALEIGIPHSDPLADGPVIQRAGKVALEHGMTVSGALDVAKAVAAEGVPVVLMTYINPVLSYDPRKFSAEAAQAGVVAALRGARHRLHGRAHDSARPDQHDLLPLERLRVLRDRDRDHGSAKGAAGRDSRAAQGSQKPHLPAGRGGLWHLTPGAFEGPEGKRGRGGGRQRHRRRDRARRRRRVAREGASEGVPVRGIRGATTATANTAEAITEATEELLRELVQLNDLDPAEIAFAYFTTTPDLNAEFPALAARRLGWLDVPLLCGHDMNVQQPNPRGVAMCVRILLLYNTPRPQATMRFAYMRGAGAIKADLDYMRGSLKP